MSTVAAPPSALFQLRMLQSGVGPLTDVSPIMRVAQALSEQDVYTNAEPALDPAAYFRVPLPVIARARTPYPCVFKPGDYKRAVKVELYTTGRATAPGLLRSGGLGPCCAISFYDPTTKTGYMAHVDHVMPFDGLIQEILDDCEDPSRLSVVVFGNSDWTWEADDYRAFELQTRPYVLERLAQYVSPSQVYVEWARDGVVAELFLDAATGEVTFEEKSIE